MKQALSGYGELRSEVIRFKYKSDHDLAGLENGNRLVKMVREKNLSLTRSELLENGAESSTTINSRSALNVRS